MPAPCLGEFGGCVAGGASCLHADPSGTEVQTGPCMLWHDDLLHNRRGAERIAAERSGRKGGRVTSEMRRRRRRQTCRFELGVSTSCAGQEDMTMRGTFARLFVSRPRNQEPLLQPAPGRAAGIGQLTVTDQAYMAIQLFSFRPRIRNVMTIRGGHKANTGFLDLRPGADCSLCTSTRAVFRQDRDTRQAGYVSDAVGDVACLDDHKGGMAISCASRPDSLHIRSTDIQDSGIKRGMGRPRVASPQICRLGARVAPAWQYCTSGAAVTGHPAVALHGVTCDL